MPPAPCLVPCPLLGGVQGWVTPYLTPRPLPLRERAGVRASCLSYFLRRFAASALRAAALL